MDLYSIQMQVKYAAYFKAFVYLAYFSRVIQGYKKSPKFTRQIETKEYYWSNLC